MPSFIAFVMRLLTPQSDRLARRRRRRTLALEPLEDRHLLSAGFTLVNDWGSGFQGEIAVKNDVQPAALKNWRLEFNFDRQITQIWNAVIVSHAGNHYVVEHAAWNADVAPNATVSFGFLGATGNVANGPTDYVLNGGPGGGPATLAVADASVAEGD